jgi:hypothetical protein
MEKNDTKINKELMVSNSKFFQLNLKKNKIINKNGITSITFLFLIIFRLLDHKLHTLYLLPAKRFHKQRQIENFEFS